MNKSSRVDDGTERPAALRVERRDDVALVLLDTPGRSLNTLDPALEEPFAEVLQALEYDRDVTGIVLASGKDSGFLAGADIEVLAAARSAPGVEQLARRAQAMMDRLAAFPKPTVAAIWGPCLGGGLELAMACDQRVASPDAKFAQPEVMLGLIPGAGGTQRLPRLIGLAAALDLILTGKTIDARRALRLGVIDEVVHRAVVIEVGVERARKAAASSSKGGLARSRRRRGASMTLRRAILEGNPLGRRVLFDQARKRVLAETHGNMPAPLRALDVVAVGRSEGFAAGLAAEARAFGELSQTPQSQRLIELFFARQALEKERWGIDVEPLALRRVGVLGAGLMGAGIAYVTASEAGLSIRLKDRDDAGLRGGLATVAELTAKAVEHRRLSPREGRLVRSRVSPTLDYSGFGRADVVIEAVFEDLELKRRMVAEVEAVTPAHAIFASNTSSLPIQAIAQASRRPERVLGMHYFSPVHRMPLLEVVVTPLTAPEATITAVELGRRQGKTVVVVNDGPGFYTSRILAPFVNEAAYVLAGGTVGIEELDRAVERLGFPVGPARLLDEVGIDVAAKIAVILETAFGARMRPAPAMARIVADGRQGRKNGRGLYRYAKDGRGFERKGADPAVYALMGIAAPAVSEHSRAAASAAARRLQLAMINEAARCYEEGVLRSARDGDIAAVFGLGYPPFLGGPLRTVDAEGAGRIVAELERLAGEEGERFEPAQVLRDLASKGAGFRDPAAPPPGTLLRAEGPRAEG